MNFITFCYATLQSFSYFFTNIRNCQRIVLFGYGIFRITRPTLKQYSRVYLANTRIIHMDTHRAFFILALCDLHYFGAAICKMKNNRQSCIITSIAIFHHYIYREAGGRKGETSDRFIGSGKVHFCYFFDLASFIDNVVQLQLGASGSW